MRTRWGRIAVSATILLVAPFGATAQEDPAALARRVATEGIPIGTRTTAAVALQPCITNAELGLVVATAGSIVAQREALAREAERASRDEDLYAEDEIYVKIARDRHRTLIERERRHRHFAEALDAAIRAGITRSPDGGAAVAEQLVREFNDADDDGKVALARALGLLPTVPSATALLDAATDRRASLALAGVRGLARHVEQQPTKTTTRLGDEGFATLVAAQERAAQAVAKSHRRYRTAAKKYATLFGKAKMRFALQFFRLLRGRDLERPKPRSRVAKAWAEKEATRAALIDSETLNHEMPELLGALYRASPDGAKRAARTALHEALVGAAAPEVALARLARAAATGDVDLASTIAERLAADEPPTIRIAACEALRRLRDPKTATALRACIDDPLPAVRRAARDALRLPKTRGPTTTRFYGIETDSDRIAFVIDRSLSMRLPVSLDDLTRASRADSSAKTRAESATEQLDRAFRLLSPTARFGVVTCATSAKSFKSRLVDATEKNRDRALAWIERQKIDGELDVFGGLTAALRIGGSDVDAPRRDGVDTIFLVTDGYANRGALVEGAEIADEFDRINRFRDIVVHTIALGSQSDVALLERLAKKTGGEFRHVTSADDVFDDR